MIDWHGLYKEGWQGEITPDAFQHPAKYSRALIRHIYKHAIDEGWLKPGDTIIDPFGGVALGGLDAMQQGLNWTGIELEPRFVDLGNQNITLWNTRYAGKLRRWGTARLLQGDSRELARLVGEAGGVVSSPPFENQLAQQDRNFKMPHDTTGNINVDYGSTPGQLGSMPSGDFDAAVSSPPYAEGCAHTGGDDPKPIIRPHAPGTIGLSFGDKSDHYGSTPGQLAVSDSFWTAARLIVDQVYTVLKPGGVAIWVVKAYVKNKQRVDFPHQWQAMCEAAGFTLLHEHHAWLVEDRGMQYDLEGNGHNKKVERKSFFRRLAEKKGSPRIDWETVLCMKKG